MALTKIKADGLTADIIDETKLADNSIDSEHYNDGSIDTAHLADDAVTFAKIQHVDHSTIVGRAAGSTTGTTKAMTAAEVRTIINVADGANQTTINTNGDNRVLTGTGTANTIQGESQLLFDSNGLLYIKAPDGGNRYFFGETGDSASAQFSLYNSSDTQKVRIAAGDHTFFNGGNVGIGTTSPAVDFSIVAADTDDVIHLSSGNNGGDSYVSIRGDNEGGIRIRGGGSGRGGEIELGGSYRNTDPGVIKFSTTTGSSFEEHMRLDDGGNLFVDNGQNNVNPGFGTNATTGNYFNGSAGFAMHSRNSGTALFLARNDSTGSIVSFNYDGGGQIADITTNGSSVSYGTGSDYRLKENITTLTNAIARLKNLKPSRFNFLKTPSITQDGFIAHEVQEVVPEAVTGKKDEVRTEDGDMGEQKGDPVMQNLDVAKLVPLVTAALQELITRVEKLEAA